MGYHVADKMSTMLIYGKDNTSAGLREIDVILEAIRQGEFLPDAKRSEMFPNADDAAKLLESQDQSGFDGYCSGSSSEDSADEDQPDHLAHETAEKCDPRQVGRGCGRRQAARRGSLFQASFVEDDSRPRGRIGYQVHLWQGHFKELRTT